MNLTFLSENGTTFAIAQNQKYHGRIHDELMYAEIVPFSNGVHLRWNDNFFSPEPFSSLEEAKQYVKEHHLKHTPESNGKAWV
jgi:hypothetical protein